MSKHDFDPDVKECPDFIKDKTNLDLNIVDGVTDTGGLPQEPEFLQDYEEIPEKLDDGDADIDVSEQYIKKSDLTNQADEMGNDTLIEIIEVSNDFESQEDLNNELKSSIPEQIMERFPSKYCRSCGKSPNGCYTRFTTKFEDEDIRETTLNEMYFNVTGIKPHECQEMSQAICYECEAKLKFAFKFRQFSLKTEKMMLEKIERKIEILSDKDDWMEFEEEALDDSQEIEENDFLDDEELEPIQEPSEMDSIESPIEPRKKRKRKTMKQEETILEDGVFPIPMNELLPTPTSITLKPRIKKVLPVPKSKSTDESDTELEYCERNFSYDVEASISQTPPLTCETCTQTFDTKDTLIKHNVERHGRDRPFKATCRKQFSTKNELELHNEYMHKPAHCALCHILFANQFQLEAHSLMHTIDLSQTKVAPPLWRCEECNVTFFYEHSHILHVNEHQRCYNCEHCSSKFKEKSNLVSHIKRRHRCVCDICGNSYGSQSILKVHQRSHTGERPFHCTMCDKRLISSDALKVHLKYVHNAFGNISKICTICNKTFNSKNGFVRHNRIHTGELFECTIHGCGKKFTGKSVLKKHIELVHDDVRAYSCTLCIKKYKSNAHLTKHVETEHLKLRYLCPICNKTITNRWDFNYHVKRSHPDQLDIKPIEISQK